MGEIIPLPRDKQPQDRRAEPFQSAEILLFMGVRYERIAPTLEPQNAPDPKKPRGRRRA